jgi:hypothetical protein
MSEDQALHTRALAQGREVDVFVLVARGLAAVFAQEGTWTRERSRSRGSAKASATHGAPLPVRACALPPGLSTVSREFTVAGGRFAPGHLGELTQVLPFDLVDAVLEETLSVQRRLRHLPSRVGVYFVLAMCLFPEVGCRLVWQKLTGTPAGAGLEVAWPSAKAQRRRRRCRCRRHRSGPESVRLRIVVSDL